VARAHYFTRAGAREDAVALGELHVAAWRAAYTGLFPDELLARLSVAERIAGLRDRLALSHGPDYFVLVAESIEDGSVAGFVSAGGSRDEDRKASGEVYALYVHPAHWGAGAGSLLLAEALHRFGEARYESAILWVLERNVPARAFYEHAGWRADGATRPFVYESERLNEVRYLHDLD